MRRFGYRTVAEALRGVAGLYVVDDRMTERLGIRGLQILGDFNTRILVLVDGATVNEPWNQFVGIGFDLPVAIDDVERIEVVRGPVSSVYGTNAFFGIINIVTRGADRSPGAYGRTAPAPSAPSSGAPTFATGEREPPAPRQRRVHQHRAGETLDDAGRPDGADGRRRSTPRSSATGTAPSRRCAPTASSASSPFAPYDTVARRRPQPQRRRDADGRGRLHPRPRRRSRCRPRLRQPLPVPGLPGQRARRPTSGDTGDSTWVGAELRAPRAPSPARRLGLTVGARGDLEPRREPQLRRRRLDRHRHPDDVRQRRRLRRARRRAARVPRRHRRPPLRLLVGLRRQRCRRAPRSCSTTATAPA